MSRQPKERMVDSQQIKQIFDEAADLLNHTLINLDGMTHATEDWSRWLSEHQVILPASSKLLGFDSYDNVIQSALDGQGIALGFSGLLTGFLDDGRLLRPIEGSLTLNHAVFLIMPSASSPTPKAQQFIDWILREAGD